ncbi:hypothetical protein ACSLPC_26160 [Escherichia coli]|uniref:hypothetical protein n=1 Tax=Escherichia coli TaxID=562 RepID=UPI003EDED24F
MCEIFRSYKGLVEADNKAFKELLEEKGRGKWQESDLYYYHDLESFAEYELLEGWYMDSLNFGRDFRGAPNPMSFIDLEGLGSALSSSWDNSCHFKTSEGKVISTSYGW